ncbi:putative transcription factor interactor and regulator Znf-B family [Rosa chinensis]|uniref:Putative transcription factor interactor and regulator Znf-B family n=1 Tax=Rosa chinensis TaxID=74649 RepID=A0A2P6S2N5_ROSCH|nr:zinc finger protein CONSTANS-LIKE 4 [Rosa chinensis]PRQ52949.1 putative transcription factor interactor and regulator Znf-B family [Rosa chinensis]
MKNCELCHLTARTYCESDQAILCWDCDFKVHGANFLVARHSRTLLCHACHAPTAWKASGEKLGHTFSVCERCVARNESRDDEEESQAGNDDATDDDDLDDSDYDDDDGDIDFDEDGDNQVVPWGSTPPPPAASSTSSDEVNNDGRYGRRSFGVVSLKRTRDNASDLRSLDDLRRLAARLRGETAGTAHSGRSETDSGATLIDCRRPSKDRRVDLNGSGPRFSPAIESTRRNLRQNGRRLSEAVDLDSSEPRIPPI